VHFAATIERAEKQIILARQARRILNLLDDTPIVPGDTRAGFEEIETARQVLNDAEDELRSWQPNLEPIHSNAGSLGAGAMPGSGITTTSGVSTYGGSEVGHGQEVAQLEKTSGSRSGSQERPVAGGSDVQPPYPMTETERRDVDQAGVV
jgi:hypothetical protein